VFSGRGGAPVRRVAGLDAGADTIERHLLHRHQVGVSRATIHRILTRAGAVVPDPGKRPRSSYLRFAAELPNECWQSDHSRCPTSAAKTQITDLPTVKSPRRWHVSGLRLGQ